MAMTTPAFTLGIEEEYLLVDLTTCDLISDPPEEIFETCRARLGGRVMQEFLRSQIEVGTGVCRTVQQARDELVEMRSEIADVARAYNAAPIAASTHPFARWQAQHHTDKDRYNVLAHDMQVVARRLLIAGMHVHAGVEDEDLRIDLMNQARYFLPHLLALSSSSPFWQGDRTGLKAYRLAVFDELPRTGLPATFSSFGEFRRTVDVMVAAGLIEDASKLWWDLRPHHKFPTLEMRITDICTDLNDAIAIAATYQCLLRMLYRLRRNNQRWRTYARVLLEENRWRALRYCMQEGLVDFGKAAVCALCRACRGIDRTGGGGCSRSWVHARGGPHSRHCRTWHQRRPSIASIRRRAREERRSRRGAAPCGPRSDREDIAVRTAERRLTGC